MDKTHVPMRQSETTLLKKICEPMTAPGKRAIFSINNAKKIEDLKDVWVAYFILDYATTVRNSNDDTESKLHAALLDKNFVNFKEIQGIPSEKSVSTDKSKNIFECLAIAQHIDLITCVLNFLIHCNDNGWQLVIFTENIKDKKFDHTNPKYTYIDLESEIENLETYIKEYLRNQSNHQATNSENDPSLPAHYKGLPEIKDRFQSKIRRLLEGDIYYRKELIKNIEHFIEKNDSGYFTIVGGAGMGKSCIVAQFIQHQQSQNESTTIWHFNDLSKHGNTREFMRSMFAHLNHHFDVLCFEQKFEQIISGSKSEPELLNEVFEYLHNTNQLNKKLIILVDALDEVEDTDPSNSASCNVLYLPETLCPNIYIIVTSRTIGFDSGNSSDRFLSTDREIVCPVNLNSESEDQRRDVKAYIQSQIKTQRVSGWINVQDWGDSKISGVDQFTAEILTKSQYSFIYLFYVFREIEQYEIGSKTAYLPSGLNNYYEKQLKRMLSSLSNDDQLHSKSVLDAILQFPPRISLKNISRFCEVDENTIEKICETPLSLKLIERIALGADEYYGYFHLSFYEFLRDNATFLEKRRGRRYEKLANQIQEDFSFGSNKFAWKVNDDLLKQDTVKLLIDICYGSERLELLGRKGNELTFLQHLFANYEFSIEVINNASVVEYLKTLSLIYDALLKRDSEEIAELFSEAIFENISLQYHELIKDFRNVLNDCAFRESYDEITAKKLSEKAKKRNQ